MTSTRREFLGQAGAIGVTAALAGSAMGAGLLTQKRKPMKILFLGGTGFAGPPAVRRAIANGHEVTLFNRGQTGPDMFPDLEHVQGDRYTDLSGLEKLVTDGRKFDAVIDTFTYVPETVTNAMDILLPAMGQYVVISTTSVYASRATPGMDETGEKATVDDATAAEIKTHRDVGMHYGAMKMRVEEAAEQRFPGKVCVIRPGLIVGERDTTGRYSYWPIRASEGGTMIGPGSGDDFVQYIDVRDLGDFMIHCIEQKHMGAYNGISPAGARTSRDMVQSAVRVARKKLGVETKVEWVDEAFLDEQGVQAWQHMPAWVPNSAEGYEGQGQLSTTKSIAAGLKTRDIDDTAWNALSYFIERGKELEAERGSEFAEQWRTRIRGGLPAEREREVLKLWKEREHEG
ncbi:MAG: epimerase [Phycisphaerae bacterium]|nr:epimerase [Phycisphaerae bacterium]MBM90121.1 epimerase [Phycisphaerae bacterium]